LIDEGGGRIVVIDPFMRLRIKKTPGSRLIIQGTLNFSPSLDGNERTSIHLSEGATLEIGGDFEVGNGVRIWLDKNASLFIGGRKKESSSGITSNSTILVRKKIMIGRDFVCAWQTFITDCDWHNFNGQPSQADVTIGDKVWVAHHSSVLKGTVIPDGCVIAAHSLVFGGDFSANSLIAGSPACTKRTNIFWHRDMSETQ
jgi:acetyltransferase-like isoleucine patch superfamily enzyme